MKNKITRKILAIALATLMIFSVPFSSIGSVDLGVFEVEAATVTKNYYTPDSGLYSLYYSANLDGTTCTITGAYNTNQSYLTVEIPETITYNGTTYTVTTIGSNAFLQKYWMSVVIIPDTVTTIESNAFKGSTALTTVHMGSGVKSIGDSAFNTASGTMNLDTIHYNGTETMWNDITIGSNANLDNVTIEYLVEETSEYFKVTFDTDGGSSVDSQNVESGTEIDLIKISSTKTGYTLTGWTVNGADCDDPYTVTGDVTLKAVWKINEYTVTFTVDDEEYETKIYNYGGELEVPTAPTKEDTAEFDYIFSGWGNLPETVTENATYNATWNSVTNEYTVTLVDGESKETDYPYGTEVTLPVPEAKEGYTFLGWTAEGETAYTTAYTVTADATFTAQWSINKYTVSFDDDEKTYEYGETVTAPSVVDTKEDNQTFIGWSDGSATIQAGDTFTAKENKAYTSVWVADVNNDNVDDSTQIFYTVTFDENGGTTVADEVNVLSGTEITLPTTTQSKAIFQGWTLDGETYAAGATYEVTGTVTLTATGQTTLTKTAQTIQQKAKTATLLTKTANVTATNS